MHDLLKLIATHQDAIVALWSRLAHDQPRSPYARLDAAARAATFRTCADGLLTLMQNGDTGPLLAVLETATGQRIAEGAPLTDVLAAWLLYRQAVQQALGATLVSADAWDQLVDRVDSALAWGAAVIRARYNAAGRPA